MADIRCIGEISRLVRFQASPRRQSMEETLTELEALTAEIDERLDNLADNLEAIPQLFAKAYNCQQWTLETWRTWCDARRLGRLPPALRALWDLVLCPAGLTSGYRAAAYGTDPSHGKRDSLPPRSGSSPNGGNPHHPSRESEPVPNPDQALADWRERNPGQAEPIFNYGPAEAIRDWTQTLERIVTDMAGMATDRNTLRQQLIDMIEKIFGEA